MDSQTHLCASVEQAKRFAGVLQSCIREAESGRGLQHLRFIFEQSDSKGPWRLILSIYEEDE